MVTTVPPPPVQCRSGELNDHELLGRVYRQARCATSCLDPDEWGTPGAAAPPAGRSVQSLKTMRQMEDR